MVDRVGQELPRPLVILFFLVTTTTTTATTLTGVAAGSHDSGSCEVGSASLISHVLCDPDHLASPALRHVIISLLTKYCNESGHKVVLFLTEKFAPYAHDGKPINTATGTFQDGGDGGGSDGDGERDINRLKELVVAANNLNTTTTSVIFVIGIRETLQITSWWSNSLNDRLTPVTLKEAQQSVMDHKPFFSAVANVACYLCQQSARVNTSSWTMHYIILTVVWVVFTVAFIFLLAAIAFVMIRGRHKALKARTEEGQRSGNMNTAPLRSPFTRGSEIQDFSVVSFTSTGHVLLGSTDIEAIQGHDCASTDNLLQD